METKGLTALRISLASPETIRSWSYGEVLKPETINYRRLRPEKDGLFCEAIFGPTRDWQCYCGKYKNIRYKGITCDKCGVEVTRSSVRRERMGHIELAAPVAHVWYTRRIPSYLGLLLDISRRNLDRVLYFAQYVVTYVDEDARQKALKRLEDKITVAERELASSINARIAEIKAERDRTLNELAQHQSNIETKYNEKIAEQLEPIINAGKRLEDHLQESLGTAAKTAIHFPDTDAVIVEEGATINKKHLSEVQKVVKKRLEEIEENMKDMKQRELEGSQMERERVRAEADLGMENLRSQLDDQSVVVRDENSRLRDELFELRPSTFMGETRYRELKSRWGQVFRADMGAEAFHDILRRLDLDKLSQELWHEVRTSRSKQKRKKATKRLGVVEAFRRSGNRPEWMILTVLPVIPPDLRPMVQLDGGRFATSDLNDLYRRVINRNNRLKRLLELGAPDVIVRNEKRMLQEAVDSLIDNSQRGKALSRRGRRELKSLSDMLKGKKGRFRRNLLGKRVDYSGRSVIVVGPQLKLYQCGLPKTMALELYRPFVISRLVSHNYAANVKGARRFIERNRPEVWEVLEEVIKERPVLLNRAPTLHRLGIQAFEPILIEGSAIQLHPLVTTAFNADFDGDQMAVHVPLSQKAVWEARQLMLSSRNLLKPADGEPIIIPSKDMVLGVYYLTKLDDSKHTGDGRVFADIDEAELAYRLDQIHIHANIQLLTHTWYDDENNRLPQAEQRLVKTTIGRVLFNRVLPPEMQFINQELDKGGLKDLIAQLYEVIGEEDTPDIADAIKDIGFTYATRSGYSLAVSDITVPEEKSEIISKSLQEADVVMRDFRRGLLTEQEQNERVIEIWQRTTNEVADAVRKRMDPNGNLAAQAVSGATKGGFGPISQLAGMRGLMADPSGRIIPLPIRSNFREGLNALEYFISTHGARKGLADTALRTADAGYLTRRLVDVAQDVIINDDDCETSEGVWIRSADDVAGQPMSVRLFGRLACDNVIDPATGEILAERNDILDHDLARRILNAGIKDVKVRSPLTCELIHGICARCYGLDLGRGKMVEVGSAVGIVAAQSIGEPGTQLTLRTFHTGGVATGGDITTGLPRVEELFEARRMPKGEAVVSEISGVVTVSQSDRYSDLRIARVEHSEMIGDEYNIPDGWLIAVSDEDEVSQGAVLARLGDDGQIVAQNAGRVRIESGESGNGSSGTTRLFVSYESRQEASYDIPSTARMVVRDGERVEAGQPLTEGSLNPHQILRIQGRQACQMYLMSEVQKVYRSQGQNINDKHFEVVIRKMISKVQLTRPGNTNYLPGDLVDFLELRRVNDQLLSEGRRPAKFIEILLGITKASLSTDSFLSASSFQHTIKVLAGAAIASTEDPLFGLKENVIIGKLIPAGTGFVRGRFNNLEEAGHLDPSMYSEYPYDNENLTDLEFDFSD
ncbi:MAG: DNA-directed RNA polymerase subunit beta' [Anaerolineae bacterium UTCFX2]|nr:DNA-directed RNA polymerase subunit beta' [Anaerolineales bacterium]OQY91969.1 MAG: DNA-directed RNA polymerase subunit beta' [Anaerolineae bacterium UTCFX2]